MELDELKEEAEKHGYRLVKKLILLPCPICGKVPTLWLNANGLKSYACVTCDKTGWAATTEEEAIELWNYHAERREDQDEFIEKLADAIVKKNEERSEEKWREWVKSQMRDPEEVAKATGTEPSHTVGGWTIEGEGKE